MPKLRRGANRFVALQVPDSDDESKPTFQLAAPTFAGQHAPADDGTESHRQSGVGAASPDAAAACGGPIPGAAPGAAPGGLVLGGGGLDLAAVAEELLQSSASRPLTLAEAAWDFSGLADSAGAAKAKLEADVREAEERQRVQEARLAAAEADKAMLRERLDRSGMSHKQRERYGFSVRAGEDSNSKLAAKAAKRAAAAKRRNAAKHAY
jgi:hypothetical protein